MSRAGRLCAIALWSGCAGDKAPTESSPDSPGRDSVIHESGVHDSTADSDSGTPEPAELTGLAVQLEDTPSVQGLSFTAARLRFGAGPLLSQGLGSAPLDGLAFTLPLPIAAPADHLAPLSARGDSDGAIYTLLVFEDADGDGHFSEGEPLLGGQLDRYLIWLEDDGGEGWPTGWSLVDLGASGQHQPNRCWLDSTEPLRWREGFPVFHPVSDVLGPALRGVEAQLQLSATGSELPQLSDAVMGLPLVALNGGPRDPAFDVPLEAQGFSAALQAPPPPEHDLSQDPEWRFAAYYNLPYHDVDGDGYAQPDPIDGSTTCLNDVVVYTRYTRPVHSYRGFRFLECYSGTVGWRAALTDPDTSAPRFLSSEQAASLTLHAQDCRVGE